MGKRKVKQRKLTAKQKLKSKSKQADPEGVSSSSEEEEENVPETKDGENEEQLKQSENSANENEEQSPDNAPQNDQNANTTQSNTESKVVVKCRHLKQANPANLKKNLTKQRQCEDCVIANFQANKKNKNKNKSSSSGKPKVLWMCVTCGNIGCGRDANAHAQTHHAFKHHSLVINLDTMEAYCYDCDEYIEPVDKVPEYQKLNECIEEVQFSFAPKVEEPKPVVVEKPSKKESKQSNNQKESQMTGYNGIRGLNNLGNTCFFNAVMQNLTHTPILRDYLLAPSPNMEGPLTSALRDFMFCMWKQTGSSHNPKQLLTEICKNGGRQQDSQELLRYLLDGLDTEEKKRVKMGSSSIKEVPDGSNLNMKNVSYTQQKGFIEEIFGGLLSSTVVCSVCKTPSRVTEPFLDLSLEIPERFLDFKRVQKKGKKDDDIAALIANEKNPKRRKKLQRELEVQRALKEMMPEKQKEPEANGKEDDKLMHDTRPPLANPSECSLAACIHAFTNIEILQGENGFGCLECTKRELASKGIQFDEKKLSNAEVNSESESDEETEQQEDDKEKEEPQTQQQENATSETTQESNSQTQDSQEQPDVWNQLSKEDDSQQADFFSNTTGNTNNINNGHNNDKKNEKKTDNNKKDSKSKQKPSKPSKPAEPTVKLIKRTATKQFMIHKQPRILTLHLKRFSSDGWSLAKIGKFVKFPTILDLNPYCDPDEQRSHLKKYMYRLYGIVVHGGGLGSGHYVAYVRKNLSPNGDDTSGSVLSEISHPDESESKAKWYYFSDSYFREASENEVLAEEAYLLFYERFVVPEPTEDNKSNVTQQSESTQKSQTEQNDNNQTQTSETKPSVETQEQSNAADSTSSQSANHSETQVQQ